MFCSYVVMQALAADIIWPETLCIDEKIGPITFRSSKFPTGQSEIRVFSLPRTVHPWTAKTDTF